jgi:hypothetical protein
MKQTAGIKKPVPAIPETIPETIPKTIPEPLESGFNGAAYHTGAS